MSAWSTFFSWPGGGVWGNIVAGAMWSPMAGGALYAYHRLSRGWHRRERERVAAAQTRELKEHIDMRLGGSAP